MSIFTNQLHPQFQNSFVIRSQPDGTQLFIPQTQTIQAQAQSPQAQQNQQHQQNQQPTQAQAQQPQLQQSTQQQPQGQAQVQQQPQTNTVQQTIVSFQLENSIFYELHSNFAENDLIHI